MVRTLASIVLALAGATALPARSRETPIAVPAGKAVDCVQLSNIQETRVRDDRTIDFVMRNRRIYRNTLPYSCPQLGFEESFSYKTSLSQLCSVDTITVLNRGGGFHSGATCGLGPFQPVTLSGKH